MYIYRKYTFINILGLADFVLQMYIITREQKKKTYRTKSVVIMWILLAFQELTTVIVVEKINEKSVIVIPILKLIITILLIICTCLLK